MVETVATKGAQAVQAALHGWHVVAHTAGLTTPGAVKPVVLAPGALDEPIVLIRTAAGALKAFSNVCTHRGHLLVEAAQDSLQKLQCRYHGRCFSLDGRVVRAPGFEGLDIATLEPLPEVAVAEWGPLIFASLAPDIAFDDWMAGVPDRLGFLSPAAWPLAARTVYDVEADWRTYVENYLEGLHIPFVHPGLARVVDWRAYRYVLLGRGALQVAEASTRDDQPTFALPAGHPDVGRPVTAFYFWLFPTTMLNVYPWGLSLNVVEPAGPDRTRVVFEAFVGDPTLRGRGAGHGLDEVEREDEAVVMSVQKGMRARLFKPGRLSPQHEVCVDHFRRLLAAMGES